ncbi:MAG: assimilatory sulfite reductase (NADPH) hemoprotein subunit [Bacteroidota bacterium]|nr:sulfite reductase [Odoribacter sp.]MDP3643967.1 assimilatory sulfite reductase (NADPH) hemoprotein subunit [Bacteroidota bacterium]
MSDTINWKLLSEVEKIKYDSNYLRGTLVESLADPITGSIALADTQISKFHGIYQQSDRDLEKERKRQKLEPAYSFLIRVRIPGGVVTPKQWLQMDDLSEQYANHTLKLTTRQAFQLHGVIKKDLKKTIQGINAGLMDTIAACGDVNRNVMCHPNPAESELHAEVYETARRISEHLLPSTTAYHEIWLNQKLIADSKKDVEPIYGDRYLPRKFKITVAIPPYNDSDIFSQDLGFIAIVVNNRIVGYNVAVGGGMGSTFGMPEAYPRLADVIGFCTPGQALDVAEKVVLVQRDNGNRQNRKRSRLKYTIDDHGIDWFINELHKYLGFELQEPRPFNFTRNGDRLGWKKGTDSKWSLTLFIEGGRVADKDDFNLKSALREIAHIIDGKFILTGNQNLIIANLTADEKKNVSAILKKNGVVPGELSGLRHNSIACVALNTCGLAFAEAERYLPSLVTKIETILVQHELFKEEIVIRMTGCPNGCGRPYLAEIGFIGKSEGHYNLYLGGNFNGTRLNTLYKETLTEAEILAELSPILSDYAQNRIDGEKFGDFVIRKQYVKETLKGSDFKH